MISLATIASTFVIQVQSYGQMGKAVPLFTKWLFINKIGKFFAWDFKYFQNTKILPKQLPYQKNYGKAVIRIIIKIFNTE